MVVEHYPQDYGGREWRKAQSRAARRHDDRLAAESHEQPPIEKPRAPARKNRRDWCRGKVGVPHVKVWVRSTYWPAILGQWHYEEWRCSRCGRKFNYRRVNEVTGQVDRGIIDD